MDITTSNSDKRTNILQVATQMFNQYGFRRTSMDLLAQRADVSKTTIYSYFKSKDELFVAVCEFVGIQILNKAQIASDSSLSIIDKISEILYAKFTTVFELVISSPHAIELINTQNRAARESIDKANTKLLSIIRNVLENGELNLKAIGLSSEDLAKQLMLVGHGASYGANTVEEHNKNIRDLVSIHLRSGLKT